MQNLQDTLGSHSRRLLGAGALTIFSLLLAFAAFDDITTGNETDFTAEYVAAAGCWVCLLFVSTRLLRQKQYVLACISVAVLAGALWAWPAIRPGIVTWPRYLVALGAFVWFAGLALLLFVTGWKGLADSRSAMR